jgi:hypothetical protein
MIEQRQNLELFYINDTVEEQNRIIRQINDFMVVLVKALCEYIDPQVNLRFLLKTRSFENFSQSLNEIPIDFIQRLKFLSDLISKTIKTILTEPTDEDVSFFNRHSIVNRFDYSGSSDISNSST